MGRGDNRTPVLGQAHEPHAVLIQRTIQKARLAGQGLFHRPNEPIGALLPPAGGCVGVNCRRLGGLRRQPIPESIVAHGAADEHLARLDCRCEFQNGYDLQLPAVVGLGVLWVVKHQRAPPHRQGIGSDPSDPVIVAVRRPRLIRPQ